MKEINNNGKSDNGDVKWPSGKSAFDLDDDDPGSAKRSTRGSGCPPAPWRRRGWRPQQSGRSERSEFQLMGSSQLTWYVPNPPTSESPRLITDHNPAQQHSRQRAAGISLSVRGESTTSLATVEKPTRASNQYLC